jgi:trans-aconitate methyltransferase
MPANRPISGLSNGPGAAAARVFDVDAERYDSQRRLLIPCFDAFYETVLELLDEWGGPDSPAIADLGAGTGLLSAMVARNLTKARLHLIDASEKMLAQARARFADDTRFTYAVMDYTIDPIEGPWDAIVSALSIHHLGDDAKHAVYRRIFDALAPGGIFINADQIMAPDRVSEQRQEQRWQAAIRAAGISDKEFAATLERTRLDRLATVEAQLRWLREAGFVEVDCPFRQWKFAVMTGRRPQAA